MNDDSIIFETGDWLLIPPGMKHNTSNGKVSHFTYISLMFDIDDPDFRRELKLLTSVIVTSDVASCTLLPSLLSQLDTLVYKNQIRLLDKETNGRNQLSITIKIQMQACILSLVQNVIEILRNNMHNGG